MTEISFHFNIPQRVPYVCRLLRKATAKGAQLLVTGPREELEAIDRMLWQLSPVDFVGHAWMEASSGGDEGGGAEHAAMAVARSGRACGCPCLVQRGTTLRWRGR